MKRLLCLFIISILLIPKQVLGEELITNATSGVLLEASTGKIIYEKEKDKEVAIASMTKMVAQIIIFEELDKGTFKLNDKVKVSKNAADMGGSQIYISEGEEITVDDLIKGISVASGNDATVAMAEFISGTEEKFVKRMNKKVKELGLKHTNFKNCTGLDEEGHYSSAYDMALIAKHLVTKYPKILEYSSIYEDYLREDTEDKFWLVNTNKLIRFYEGADGLKTGHTDNAGYCLAATASKNGLRLIGIVLGEKESKVRNSETMELLDYGYSNLKSTTLKQKGTVVKKVKMNKATPEIVQIVLKDDLNIIDTTSKSTNKYTYKVSLNKFNIPIDRGEKIGKYCAYNNKIKINCVDLTVLEKIKKISFIDLYKKTIIETTAGNY